MLHLGVRAHDFGKLPLEELAARIAAHGLTCVQLAPAKAIAGCNDDDPLTPEFAARVREAFARHRIEIAVLSCYINLGDRDAANRARSLGRFKEHLRVARAFGCRVVGTETGSVNSDFSRHPDNTGESAFQTVLGGVMELAHAAEQHDAVIGIEAVERYVISSPRRLRRLVDEIASPRVRVILDPVNLLCATNHAHQSEILQEALSALGHDIEIIHAKDFMLTAAGQYQEAPAGHGSLDYAPLLRWIKANRPGIPVLLENTAPAIIAETIAFLRRAYDTA